MGKIILVTGAARSGKSSFAEKLAASYDTEVIYFATAQAFDEEMRQRIAQHKASRPQAWPTVEEPLAVAERLAQFKDTARVMLLDCVTVWLSNLLLQGWGESDRPQPGLNEAIMQAVDRLISTAQDCQGDLICVSNEVGWSLVPENSMGRFYRDLAGKVNQTLARAAEQVYLVVAGYPLEIKAQGSTVLAQMEGH